MGKIVKWKSMNRQQWHFGMVIGEATDQDPDGPYVDVEYTHSTPAANARSGRILRLYGVHKVQEV